MASQSKFVSLSGSEKALPIGARFVGPVAPAEQIELMLLLRPRSKPPAPRTGARKHMSREDYASQYGADPADVDQVAKFLRQAGLAVVSSSAAKRTVVVSGPASKLLTVIHAELGTYEHSGRRFRGRKGAVNLPKELGDLVVGVFGFDNRPAAKPHLRLATRKAGLSAFTPLQLGQLYGFPTDATGKGQCIALVELGGGYTQADLDAYFQALGLSTPKVVSVSVQGGSNAPTGQTDGPDGEVMLDIEVAGALAPDAKVAVYFAPNTDAGFLDAILTAIHDGANQPSVVSISWGGAEANWTDQSLQAFDQAFVAAGAMGVSVCCAAGDDGATDGVADGRFHVDFPASSPHVLACGGTRLVVSNGAPSETAWNDLAAGGGATGGGVSDKFGLPPWQADANVPASANPDHRKGRGVPDVAGDADPATGYSVRVDGQDMVIGGTSAVAPLWAALLARCNEKLGGSVGFVNAELYAKGESAFRDVVSGSNGPAAYQARAGWDACTGLGTPIGTRIVQEISPS
ncbi:MAG TPA: S53 family peptidase [Anaeromyxobacteraceae bacterium]|nr:S53 family peptidase [Anaeromyxobacteraceae bacterium]